MPTITNQSIGRTDTGTGSGTLIPDAQRREILQDLPKASAVLALGNRIALSTKVTKQPVLSSLPVAYWVNGDTGLKGTTKEQWTNKTITAEELAVVLPIPQAVLDDAAYDLWGEVRPRITEAIGKKLDAAVLFGEEKPTSWENAIVPAAIAAGNSLGKGNKDLAEDINQVMAKVEADGFNVNGFAAKTKLKARLRGLRDSNNSLLFEPTNGVPGAAPGTLYGEPIYYPDANGAWNIEWVDLIGGDWTNLVVGVRQDITFTVHTDGVISDDNGVVVLNLMQQDSAAIRVVARYGYTVANPVTQLNPDGTTRYPFSVLEGPNS